MRPIHKRKRQKGDKKRLRKLKKTISYKNPEKTDKEMKTQKNESTNNAAKNVPENKGRQKKDKEGVKKTQKRVCKR